MHTRQSFFRTWRIAAGVVALATALSGASATAQEIKIGFGMALTGGLAPNGKSALLGMKIWEEDINAKGGLLGKKVKLVYYDDKSTGSEVPAIYAKLLDIDKVDMIVAGYATGMIAPAMPVAMQRKKVLPSLFGTGVNSEFKYDKYFSMIPTGPDPKPAFTKPFFDAAMAQSPKPETISLAAADAEFGRNVCEGARENAKKAGLKIVYDKNYPPPTTDFAPIIRAIQATNPDIAVFCSYPPDSVGLVRAINEVGFKAKIVGGAMVGLQATAIKRQLGPLLNGITNYETWVPSKTMEYPGTNEFLARYQARAGAEGVDPLGYYLGTWGYAYAQLIGQAIAGAGTTDDEKLAAYFRSATFDTILGPVKFGAGGEWAESRMIAVQYHGIKDDALDQFKGMNVQTIVAPPNFATGKMVYPYEKAK
ncbi:MAG TPA: amino acid ABC transporter substrate-binding protein [Hyphomicrobiaceae bacterium]|jgi:branched-chain amino acid transport system substrate-binding protein|nr:amino acid ABC transporter substrate-binding protein [Hyphomicrobiaceae bacterium]